MNEYKVGKAFEYVEASFLKEIFYHPISTTSSLCFLRAKCTPSQRLKQESHILWMAVLKETGDVKSAFCSCTAGMGQTCNHVAALLFRVESANRLGVTSCTSLPCYWKVPTATHVQPSKITEMNVKKSRHGRVKSRSLVSSQKTEYKPQMSLTINKEALIEDLRKALPNACVFKGIDLPEASMTSSENTGALLSSGNNSQTDLAQSTGTLDIESFETVEDFLGRQPILRNETVTAIQEKTVGQNKNSYWYRLRKGRITASNFYPVFTRVNSYKKNADIDLNSSISTVMGSSTPNPNIRALKYGRETEPIAKEIYCQQYKSKHVNARFQDCGLFLDSNNSFLAASPDMLVTCDCCGEGLLEIKCTLIPKCDSCSTFCTCSLPDYLTCANEVIDLKKNHKYFCQVQGQMAITQRRWCDFFVYSCNGTFLKRIMFQDHYYGDIHENLVFFFKMFIAPKIVEGQIDENDLPYAVTDGNETMDVEVEKSGRVYFCLICNNQVLEKENIKSFGQRSICCDLCDMWFHFKCVGITKASLGNMATWLCTQCKTIADVHV